VTDANDAATPAAPPATPADGAAPLLRVRDLEKVFPIKKGLLRRTVAHVRAVDGVSFDIARGEVLGLVGESGSGKSTTGRLLLRLIEPTGGSIELEGKELRDLEGEDLRAVRRDMQMVFQDPYSSLDPLAPVADIVGEPFQVHFNMPRKERDEKVVKLLEQVGLSAQHLRRFPAEFSGGQRQRIAVARALALEPKLIVADEPVSALDVSVQAQVLNLMQDLQDAYGVTYLFISHDLSVVDLVCDEVIVLEGGRIVEQGDPDRIFQRPQHPYTQRLLAAVPGLHPPGAVAPGAPCAGAQAMTQNGAAIQPPPN
jgi:ABC-type oligopeptide transport system ATPase subunit